MKWILEISDSPENKDYPIIGYQVSDSGAKRGPYHFKVSDIIDSLTSPMFESIGEVYSSALGTSFKNEKRIPTLPSGTIGYSSTEDGRERVSMVVNKNIWPVKYRDNKEVYFIGFPKLIVQYVLQRQGSSKNRSIIATKIFAIQDNHKPVTDETELYVFPFPNVSKSDGSVCWGDNREFLTISNLTELERMFSYFVNAPFSDDWGMRLANGYANFGKYIESEQDKPFNDELLLPFTIAGEPSTFKALHPNEYIYTHCQ